MAENCGNSQAQVEFIYMKIEYFSNLLQILKMAVCLYYYNLLYRLYRILYRSIMAVKNLYNFVFGQNAEFYAKIIFINKNNIFY